MVKDWIISQFYHINFLTIAIILIYSIVASRIDMKKETLKINRHTRDAVDKAKQDLLHAIKKRPN